MDGHREGMDVTNALQPLDLSEVKDGLNVSNDDNLSDLSPDTQHIMQQIIKDIKHGIAKVDLDEEGHPKLEYKQARKMSWDGSNANVISTPRNDKDVKLKLDSWIELFDYLKTEKPPSGILLDPTKVTLFKRLYRENSEFEKTAKVLGSGTSAGDICVVKDKGTKEEHALKKMMLSVCRKNEIRCLIDMSETGLAPRLYLFNIDGKQVNIHMESLENAVTLRSVIDEHMSDFFKCPNDAALVKPFSLFVLDGALQAVSTLHSKGWTHRDLHGGNVMLQKSSSESLTVKILDFGLAEMLEGKTGLDYRGFRADISEIVRLFSALYTGEEFDNVLDVQHNWKPKLEELPSHISESDGKELFCLIDGALAIVHHSDVEKYGNKVKQHLSLAMGDTHTHKDIMRRVVGILFSNQDFNSLKQEDKTGLRLQCKGGSQVKEDEEESFTPVAGNGPLCDLNPSNDLDKDDIAESLHTADMGIQRRLP